MASGTDTSRRFTVGLLVLLGVAFVAVSLNETGLWVGDARYEIFENPSQRLRKMFSMWDSSRGLGRERGDFWPGITLFAAFFRALGFSTWVVERLWHGTLISLGGAGTALFLRSYRPRAIVAPLIAAAVYMFGPYSVAFLLPSNLYLNYAAAPWIWLLFWRGAHTRSWRPIGLLAIVVLLLGNTEAAGTAFAFLYLVPIALHAVLIDRTLRWRDVFAWGIRFAALAAGIAAAVVAVVVISADVFDQNLRETESPLVLNVNSSWAETWRGLGSWLLYHRDSFGLTRPQTARFLTSWIAIVATFAIPIGAIAGLAQRRRETALLSMMMLMGLTAMVGLFPTQDPSLYGRFLIELYEAVPSTEFLRNNFKAGSGAMFGIAGLFGLAAERAFNEGLSGQRTLRHPQRVAGVIGSAAIVATLVLTSAPFWTGTLYNSRTTHDTIPSYVFEAAEWIDEQPEDGRVLFLPRSYRNGFRWGWINDDYLDSLIQRPHVVEVPIHLSREIAANLVAAVDRSAPDTTYVRGRIGPLAERLGAEFVVLRNDHDWQTWGQPRPSQYQKIRNDPSLTLVATFGEPGENVTAGGDQTAQVFYERDLPPIEVYQVSQRTSAAPQGGSARLVPAAAPLLVAGDGDAFPMLADAGILDTGRTVAYTGHFTEAELSEELAGGSPVIITDTNRRRAEAITIETTRSHTLGDGEELERPVFQLFDESGSQSVATYGDGVLIRSTATNAFTGNQAPWHRPAMAFDGDVATSWQIPGLSEVLGQTLRVDLASPKIISGLSIIADRRQNPTARKIVEVDVVLSDGTSLTADLSDARYEVTFSERSITWAELIVTRVVGSGIAPVGIDEFDIVGLDLAERIRVPSQLAELAAESPAFATQLGEADIGFGFERSVGEGPFPEERSLKRTFETFGTKPLLVSGQMSIPLSANEADLAGLQDSDIAATASTRFTGRLEFRGAAAVDGDDTTAWAVEPVGSPTLTLDFSHRLITRVGISATVGDGLSTLRRARVTIGDWQQFITFPEANCGESQCEVVASVGVPSLRDNQVVIELDRFDRTAGSPARITEVRLSEKPNTATMPSTTACVDNLVIIDGQSIPVRFDDTTDLFGDDAVAFVGCEQLILQAGQHELGSGVSARLDTVTLLPPTFVEPLPRVDGSIEVRKADGGSFSFVVDNPEQDAMFVLGQSWHPGWRATVDGSDLGPPLQRDALTAWKIPAGTGLDIEISYGPQRLFTFALLLTTLALVVSIALVLKNPFWGDADQPIAIPEPGNSRWSALAEFAIPTFFGLIVSGPTGALVAVAAVLTIRGSVGVGRLLIPAAAMALLLVAATGTITEDSIAAARIGVGYAANRPVAALASEFAAILAASSAVALALDIRRPQRILDRNQ